MNPVPNRRSKTLILEDENEDEGADLFALKGDRPVRVPDKTTAAVFEGAIWLRGAGGTGPKAEAEAHFLRFACQMYVLK